MKFLTFTKNDLKKSLLVRKTSSDGMDEIADRVFLVSYDLMGNENWQFLGLSNSLMKFEFYWRREKIQLHFIFTLLGGATEGFMKAFMAFIKPFEAPQKSVKIRGYISSRKQWFCLRNAIRTFSRTFLGINA